MKIAIRLTSGTLLAVAVLVLATGALFYAIAGFINSFDND